MVDVRKIKYFLNSKNIWIEEDDVIDIFRKGGLPKKIKPKNMSLYRTSFISREMCLKGNKLLTNEKILQKYVDEYSEAELKDLGTITDCIPLQEDCYESLEWLGDSVMKSTSSIYLFRRFPGENEGFYSTARSKIERTMTLAELAQKLNFNKFLVIPKILEDLRNLRENSKELENVFEAFYGAMMLDLEEQFGYGKAMAYLYTWLKNIYEKYLDIPEIVNRNNNYKDLLNKYFHKNFEGQTANYATHKEIESDTKKYFCCYVKDPDGKICGTAKRSTKKDAEQACAKEALIKFGQLVDNSKPKLIRIKKKKV